MTYCAPCSEALFPPLYEKLARAIGCNSALYLAVTGAGLPKAKASGAVLFETSQQLAREYADYYSLYFFEERNQRPRATGIVIIDDTAHHSEDPSAGENSRILVRHEPSLNARQQLA